MSVATLTFPVLAPFGAHPKTLQHSLLLAALVHLWLVLSLGNTPAGTALPGQGVGGNLNVRLLGPLAAPKPPSTEFTAAPEAVATGPAGQAQKPRWGGVVRDTAPPPDSEPGTARLGAWASAPGGAPLSTPQALQALAPTTQESLLLARSVPAGPLAAPTAAWRAPALPAAAAPLAPLAATAPLAPLAPLRLPEAAATAAMPEPLRQLFEVAGVGNHRGVLLELFELVHGRTPGRGGETAKRRNGEGN